MSTEPRIIEYKILSAPLKSKIEIEVTQALIFGWKPAGGITFDSDDIYYQAIYKD